MVARLIATWFYVGYLRPAPGTWGSVAAVLLAWPIHVIAGPLGLVVAALAAFGLGLWATRDYMAATGTHDPSEVVVDEVAGQWIALLPVSIGAAHAGADLAALWPGVLTAFLAFRLLDIAKPGPIGWADRMEGPMGVMLDDVIAGWIATLFVVVFAFVYHGMLGL
ncbi:phosphatidylglycerophosphatase A family protein [Ovoidimarina sediminis]|uniref:phosphatidylglycerophosphatase A family protein n=1 Tax=Ovoidimarina sediminis TaxID=3079856 RepID=UPI002908150C|nr:phosphatidylglycerophosphatase A [Rhodophyticola sp. MJ-SS7]MDU8941950.1 phosphatidylglycerophosphatase A [Rhodophyticola sp. MJ-SS7]